MSGRGDKNVGFEREKKRLEQENFKSIYDGVWIGAVPPRIDTEMFDFIFAAEVDCHASPATTMVLCWDDQIIQFRKSSLEELAKDLFLYIEPAYGYGYQRAFKFGPTFYPFGMTGGRAASVEEENNIAKWQIEYRRSCGKYKTGLLRDIYPVNFISHIHLLQKIGRYTLKDWIKSSPDHGELKPLTDILWEWWLPEDKIAAVRETLRPTGLLICI